VAKIKSNKTENEKSDLPIDEITPEMMIDGSIAEESLNTNKNSELTEETVFEKEETVFIYCGPNSVTISKYTSYKNGYPKQMEEHIEKCPIIKQMFVSPEDFSNFEQNVVTNGTVENIWFQEVQKYFSKAVK